VLHQAVSQHVHGGALVRVVADEHRDRSSQGRCCAAG
jgi:hypothetical protein